MNLFTPFKVGENIYNLRLSAGSAVELENRIGCGIIPGLDKFTELRVIIQYLWACMQKMNAGTTMDKTYEIYDQYIDNGGSQDELIDTIMECLVASGFMKKEVLTKMRDFQAQIQGTIDNQVEEKLNQQLQK